MYKHGLVIGKFMPLHKGHTSMLENALEKCEWVTVIVVAKSWEPIPGHLRYQWVKDWLEDTNSFRGVVHLLSDDSVPSDPRNSPTFMSEWVNLADQVRFPDGTPPYDAFFTGDDYDSEFADHLEAAFQPSPRLVNPISGTMIREAPLRHWEWIEREARSYFAGRIRILGGESCGKTTLAQNLADYYRTTWVPEYGRIICERDRTPDWNTSENGQRIIDEALIYQQEIEEDYARNCNRVVFCDTDALTTYVCAELGLEVNYSKVIQKHLVDTRKYDITFLCAPDIPWVQDDLGLRSFESRANEFFDRFKFELESRRMEYTVISGKNRTQEQSLTQAIRVVDSWLERQGVVRQDEYSKLGRDWR